MKEWYQAAFKEESDDLEMLYRYGTTNIFKLEISESSQSDSDIKERTIFKVKNTEHKIWEHTTAEKGNLDYDVWKKILEDEVNSYVYLWPDKGTVKTEQETIEFETVELTKDEKSDLVSQNI